MMRCIGEDEDNAEKSLMRAVSGNDTYLVSLKQLTSKVSRSLSLSHIVEICS
jgi:hypothetical protein